MKFQELVSISGMPGLYQLVATKSDGAIVRSIDGIEVFTTGENIRLFDVFMTMKANTASAGEFDLAKADNKAIKAHYGKLFPEFDADRVYVSDMKKMIKWCGILDAKGLLVSPAVEAEAAVEAAEAAPIEAAKPAKKTKAPKAEATEAEAPAKPKRTTKKKDADKPTE